jgi:anti-sigma factor RsiW
MDCRTFRERHVDYLDGTLDELALVQAEVHRTECPACARYDARLRRGLMVCHNLHEIAPSGDFAAKLAQRLAAERAAAARRQTRRAWVAGCAACALAIAALSATGRDVAPTPVAAVAEAAAAPTLLPAVRANYDVATAVVPVQGPIDPVTPHPDEEWLEVPLPASMLPLDRTVVTMPAGLDVFDGAYTPAYLQTAGR